MTQTMKRAAGLTVIMVIAGVLSVSGDAALARSGAEPLTPAAVEKDVAVFFSPNGGCIDAIKSQVDSAKKSIHVQAFILSTTLISRPLIEAKKRGVEVVVILDREWAHKELSQGPDLVKAGIPVYVDGPAEGSAHDKIMLIDGRRIITGSFNFSRSAEENNVENLLIINDHPRLSQAYEAHFQDRLGKSKKF